MQTIILARDATEAVPRYGHNVGYGHCPLACLMHDLLVLGGETHVLLGSVSHAVLNRAPCPVLIFR